MDNFDLGQLSPFQESEISSPGSCNLSYEETLLDNNKKGFRCLFTGCEKTFRFKSDMKRHTIIHTKDRPYFCSTCKKNFKRPDALKNHKQTHNQDYFYYCTEPGCNALFRQMNALQYHLLKNNSKRFVCDFSGCQKSFFTLQHLEQHQNAESHKKLISASFQNSDQNDIFEPFEDLAPECETNIPPLLTENYFEENFSCPESEKILHIELKNASDNIEASPEIYLPDSQEPLDFGNFFQLMICKYLLQENQKMRARLSIQTDSVKAKFESQLLSKLNKTLNSQYDLKDFS